MKRILTVLLVLALSISLVACSSASQSANPSNSGATTTSETPAGGSTTPSNVEYTFTVGITGDIAGWDPGLSYDPNTGRVVTQILEPLFVYDDNDELVGLIASKWEATDNLTYVYTIRDDVKFSDGSQLTVDDVLFSLKRIADPDGGAYMQWMYSGVESIEKTGDWEVTVKLSAPSNSWVYVLSTAAGYIISKSYYENNQDSPTKGILGSGAYVLDSIVSGQEIVLKQNENYWNGDLDGAPTKIAFKIVSDDTTLVTALKKGDIDYSSNLPLELLAELESEPNLDVNNFASRGVTFLALNTDRAPYNDVNVRRAVYYALDLQSFHENIIGNSGSFATVLPNSEALYGTKPEQWKAWLQTAPKYEYDVEKAKELLAQSAYPDGFSANVIVNQSSRYNDIALFLQESLKPLNIDIEIIKVSGEEHDNYYFGGILDADGKRDYDALIGSWWADFPDIGGNIEPIYQEGTSNVAAYNNPAVTKLLQEEVVLLDEDARNAKIFEAFDIISDEVPYIFIQYPNSQNALNNKYTGLKVDTVTSAGSLQFRKVRLK
jgi:peptide/nickel transport system substrate-binding protein